MVHYLSQNLGDYAICDSSGEEDDDWWTAIFGSDCWLWQYRFDNHLNYFNVDWGCSSTSSGNAAPLSMIQEMKHDLKIPNKVPTVDVVIVSVAIVTVMMFVVFTLWRCGFRCSVWRKHQKQYK